VKLFDFSDVPATRGQGQETIKEAGPAPARGNGNETSPGVEPAPEEADEASLPGESARAEVTLPSVSARLWGLAVVLAPGLMTPGTSRKGRRKEFGLESVTKRS